MGVRKPIVAIWSIATILSGLILVVSIVQILHGYKSEMDRGAQRVEDALANAKANVNRTFLEIDSLLASLPNLLGLVTDGGRIDPTHAQRLLRGIIVQNFLISDLAIYDGNQNQVAASAPSGRRQMIIRPEFHESAGKASTPKLIIGTPTHNPLTGEWVLHVGRPLLLIGIGPVVAIAEIQIPLIANILTLPIDLNGVSLGIEREDGRLLVSAPFDETLLSRHALPERKLSEKDASGKAELGISRISGTPALVAYRPTLYRPINVVARLPLSVVIANWRGDAILFGIASGGLIFLVLAAGAVSHAYVLQREKIMGQLAAAKITAEAANEVIKNISAISSDYFWRMDTNYRFVEAPESSVLQADPNASSFMYGQTRQDIADPEDLMINPEKWRSYQNLLNARGTIRGFEYAAIRPNGEKRYWSVNGVPTFDAHGNFTGYYGAARDITDKKLAEISLRESRETLRDAIEAISPGFLMFDHNERLILCNEAFRRISPRAANLIAPGAKFEDLLRARVEMGDLVVETDKIEEWIQNRLERFRNPGAPLEVTSKTGATYLIQDFVAQGGRRIVLRTDITEIKRSQRELFKAKEEAESANRAKSMFLANMSHELRTPLNAIIGFGQLLQINPRDPPSETQKEYLGYILRGGQHLLNLINQVLDLSKMESGNASLLIEDCEIRPILEECIFTAKTLARSKSVLVEADYALDVLPRVRADSTRLKQVLLNLLSNAIKYNINGGKVILRWRIVDSHLCRFEITDTGKGIPEYLQAGLFQPFNRLGAEGSAVEGTGIGLAISHELTRLMGGALKCTSTVDRGSTFWFDLPLAVEADRTTSVEKVGAEHTPLPRVSSRSMERTVLYVEDNPANLELMKVAFSHVDNVRLVSAHTAELGIAYAVAAPPDLILIDINLPGISGIHAMKTLRQNPETMNIPVIAVSADAMPQDIQNAMKAGFLKYLTKPLDIPKLLNTITEILNSRLTI